MSFLRRQLSKNLRKAKCALSLQTSLYAKAYSHKNKSNTPEIDLKSPRTDRNTFFSTILTKNFFSKRMSLGSSNNKGSLTIEAAIAFPIFLFAVISLLSFMEILRVQMKLNSAMQQTAKELAVYGYAAKEMTGGELPKGMSIPAGFAFSETYVRGQVTNQLGDEYLKNSPVKGSQNMTFLKSRIMVNDRIELRCFYRVEPFFALSEKAAFQTESTAIVRAFTGYDNLQTTEAEKEEEYVYITETGKVYHKTRDCHYLDLSIQKVNPGSLKTARNQSGGIYYACPLCARKGVGGVAYITNYGESYHYDLLCSGLKRTITMVPLSEVGGRGACSKCCH